MYLAIEPTDRNSHRETLSGGAPCLQAIAISHVVFFLLCPRDSRVNGQCGSPSSSGPSGLRMNKISVITLAAFALAAVRSSRADVIFDQPPSNGYAAPSDTDYLTFTYGRT